MTDLDLDAISARLLPLAPGPWCAAPSHEIYGNPPADDPDSWAWAVAEAGEDDPPIVETVFADRETATFIAAARTDVPALVAELLVLRDRITQLEAERIGIQTYVDALQTSSAKVAELEADRRDYKNIAETNEAQLAKVRELCDQMDAYPDLDSASFWLLELRAVVGTAKDNQ